MDDRFEIPEYFICPISLQIMKDPVTIVTGITYDRESIEHWLFKIHNTICPVTKQSLPRDSELTPNHTLRRLIQAWIATNGTDQIITSPKKPPLSKFYIINLIRDLWLPNSRLRALKELEKLAVENENNRKEMVESGVCKPILSIVVSCHKKGEIIGLEEALSILYLLRNSLIQSNMVIFENYQEIIDALMWVLESHDLPDKLCHDLHTRLQNSHTTSELSSEFQNGHLNKLRHFPFSQLQCLCTQQLSQSTICLRHAAGQLSSTSQNDPRIQVKEHSQSSTTCLSSLVHQNDEYLKMTIKNKAASALKIVIQKANSSGTIMEMQLKPEFFQRIVIFLREVTINNNSLLHILLETSLWGRNRRMMIESGMVFELIELELKLSQPRTEKKTTEVIFGILYHLCSSADGRAEFLNHAAGIALIARRILKVSPAADDRAILILSLICKYSGTIGVLQEMLRVGAVAKLCMVLQANCASYLKDRAREILRNHNYVWKDSPCVEIAALTN